MLMRTCRTPVRAGTKFGVLPPMLMMTLLGDTTAFCRLTLVLAAPLMVVKPLKVRPSSVPGAVLLAVPSKFASVPTEHVVEGGGGGGDGGGGGLQGTTAHQNRNMRLPAWR